VDTPAPFDHLQDLYTSNVFVTEHDTHSGGDLETRDLAELFEVNNKVLHYFPSLESRKHFRLTKSTPRTPAFLDTIA
jgi:hypothetical protein